jgi:hypothetical protein
MTSAGTEPYSSVSEPWSIPRNIISSGNAKSSPYTTAFKQRCGCIEEKTNFPEYLTHQIKNGTDETQKTTTVVTFSVLK